MSSEGACAIGCGCASAPDSATGQRFRHLMKSKERLVLAHVLGSRKVSRSCSCGDNPGSVADQDHGAWYREMFSPGVTAGLLRSADLAGYRDGQIYIRRSMHVPLRREGVVDAMSAFFDMLMQETEPAVRVGLGHFVFVYIHPYMDGNGRMGRVLMNVMLAAGGYPWTVIPLQRRGRLHGGAGRSERRPEHRAFQ